MYQPRTYRQRMGSEDLANFRVGVGETDLFISAKRDLSKEALAAVKAARALVEQEIGLDRRFLTSLEPLPTRPGCPAMVAAMYRGGQAAGVGPMAAVAGAVAEFVSGELVQQADEIVVENGGDIYIISQVSRLIGIQAGSSPLSGKLGLVVPAGNLSVCTSSGTVGHSLSLGKADAAVVAANEGALADAVATALGNRVKSAGDVQAALDWVQTVAGVRHAVVIVGGTMGVWGEFELTKIA